MTGRTDSRGDAGRDDANETGGVREGDLLFEPSAERIERAQLTKFMAWLSEERGLSFSSYADLWSWSVKDLEGFWAAFVEWAEVPFRRQATSILEATRSVDGTPSAEGARWFDGAEVNYVDFVTRHDSSLVAVVATDESGRREELTYGQLIGLVAQAAAALRGLGVGKGDRVAAVVENGIGAVVGFLAAASLGAIWSSCAPEFGAPSMLDRFRQIEPAVLLAAESYRYGGREFDLSPKISALASELPGTVVLTVEKLLAGGQGAGPGDLEAVSLPFSHPLWVLYSSGTTGLPKALVHGHGGVAIEHEKALRFHCDLGVGERFFWFTTTGWMMWNFLVGGLLTGSTIVLYDGSPTYPDPMALFAMAARERVTYFGTSAPFVESCRRSGIWPRAHHDLSSIHSLGSTGAPLSPEGFGWAARSVGDDVAVASTSGGTDVCSAFLTGCPLLPVHAGELQCAAVAVDVEAFGEDGTPVIGEVGELVVTTPMPTMPLELWNDPDGSRLHEAYFATYPGVWRHGDWVKRTESGAYVVYGRSDATLNRGGVRMGTAEFYRVIEAVPGVADSLVVDTTELGRDGELLLFVVPSEPGSMESLEPTLRATIRDQVSPRHVPNRLIEVPALPRTLNGKKVEVPIRRILLGTPAEKAVSQDALSDPAALDGVLDALRVSGLI